jgi:hypothetical protein
MFHVCRMRCKIGMASETPGNIADKYNDGFHYVPEDIRFRRIANRSERRYRDGNGRVYLLRLTLTGRPFAGLILAVVNIGTDIHVMVAAATSISAARVGWA